tara:strand:+ start:599 stop:1321 length:723 start_codon:yes stop_codon:yes gene_type:complete
MGKKLKIFLGASYLIILLLFLYYLFSNIELSRLNEFSYYKQLQINISNFVGTNFYFNIFLFFIFAVIWILLLGFGSPILILSGIFFGKWIGTFVSVISISFGALLLYVTANYFFKEFINQFFGKKFSKYVIAFKKNEFYYLFAFRFVGGLGIPFGLQNIIPVIFNISKFNYFFASLFGFVPNFFIWNTVGAGINKYIAKSETFSIISLVLSEEIYIPLIMFLILIIISIFIKKRLFNDRL